MDFTCCSHVKVCLIDFLPDKNQNNNDDELDFMMKKFKSKFFHHHEFKLIIRKVFGWADDESRRCILSLERSGSVMGEEGMDSIRLINYLKEYFVKPLILDLEIVETIDSQVLLGLGFECEAMDDGKRVKFGNSFDRIVLELSTNQELASNREYILEMVKQHPLILRNVNESLLHDKEIALEAVKKNGMALSLISGELRNDREVVLEAVKNTGNALKFANTRFRVDKEIILESVKTNDYSLNIADPSLLNDRATMLQVVRNNGYCINRVGKLFKQDREFLIESIRQHATCAKTWAKTNLTDRSLIEECVKINWKVLRFSPLQNDLDFVRELFHDNIVILSNFDTTLDINFIKSILKSKNCSYSELGLYYQTNLEIIDIAIEEDLFPLSRSNLISNDRQRMFKLLVKNLDIFGYIRYPPKETLLLIETHFKTILSQ